MSHGIPEDDARWDDEELDEIWRRVQENQEVRKSNGVEGIGVVLERVGNLTATVEKFASVAIERAEDNTKRLDKHSGVIRGAEAVAERLGQLQGMVAKADGRVQAFGEALAKAVAKLNRLEAGIESLQYWLWGLLVLQAGALLAVLLG